jgi:hypothetical protein
VKPYVLYSALSSLFFECGHGYRARVYFFDGLIWFVWRDWGVWDWPTCNGDTERSRVECGGVVEGGWWNWVDCIVRGLEHIMDWGYLHEQAVYTVGNTREPRQFITIK